MTYVDVALDVPMLRTEYVTYGEMEEVDVGVQTHLGIWEPGKTNLGFLTGLHLSWRERDDGLGMSTWELPVEASWRLFLASESFVRPFYELGAGPHLLLLLVDWSPPVPDVSMGFHLGFGATLGKGKVRGLLGVRGAATLAPDVVYGRSLTPDGDVSWYWSAAGARVDAYGGVSFW